MKKDIRDRNDLIILVDSFYEKVKQDDLIGFYFTEVVSVNWERHLPRMYDFWDNALFYTGSYEGNPMQVHKALHGMHAMERQHFVRWNKLFSDTVDELFAGEMAELIKQKAQNIATIIQVKLFA